MNKLPLVFFLLIATVVVGQERILDFQTILIVNKDRSVDVTEVIKVNVEGYNIQRGIFRDIYTTMKDERGKRQQLTLTVKEVLKNGSNENFTTEEIGASTRIKIGNADILLDNGEYTYTIKYNLNRQVRFFDTYDEVYWNVTGNDWMFSIEKASFTVILPEEATIKQHSGYSGPSGVTGCSCVAEVRGNNTIQYQMTAGLNPYEGLTVAVGWQKGVVPPPTQAELDAEEFNDNRGMYYGAFGVLVLFGYLMFAWFKVGRDPAKGSIIPRFTPPDGFSPAACRYVLRMGFDNKAFAASIVSMAVKGFLVIDQTSDDYRLKKISGDMSKLSEGEKRIADHIFRGTDTLTLDGSYDSSVGSAVTGLQNNLDSEYKKVNFFKNYGWMVPSILLSVAIAVFIFIEISSNEEILVPMIVMTFFLMFTLIPAIGSFTSARKSSGFIKYARLFIGLVFSSAVIGVPIFLQVQFGFFGDWFFGIVPYLIIFTSIILLNAIFFYLIQAPTVAGRKRMDEIEGLKMFMEVAEKDRLNMLNPPDKTPQLFEQLLPYAIALNVENEWGKQFDSVLQQAIQNNEYQPTWYIGSRPFHAYTITNSLGSSLSSSLQSSSTPPSSSSSGSGGGGSSGGGGGGGGGGGW